MDKKQYSESILHVVLMELWFVTSNENKLQETSKFLNMGLSRVDAHLQEIQAINVEDVVKEKSKQAFALVNKPVLVEDTGLYISKLNNFPGALIKWLLDAAGSEGICEMLKGPDRGAYAETYFCMYDGKDFKLFTGRVDERIVEHPKGSGGFGWDNIFQPEGYAVTFAEMSMEEKNKISMRGKALAKLKDYLKTNIN